MSFPIKQLKSLKKIGPDKNWLKENKAQLMSRFFVNEEPSRLHYWEMFLMKAGAMAMLILLATGGTLAAVSAAQNSLPGDLMYPLKLAVEKVQVRLISSEGGRADLKTEFTSRRIREFRQLVAQPSKSSPKKEKEIDNLKVVIKKSLEQDADLTEEVTLQVAAAIQKTEVQIKEVREEARKIVKSLAKETPAEDSNGQEISELAASPLAKADEAGEILAQAEQELQNLNLLTALEKAEDSRRLVQEAVELVTQTTASVQEDSQDDPVVSSEPEQEPETIPETIIKEQPEEPEIDDLTTPPSLIEPNPDEEETNQDTEDDVPDELLNVLQVQ